MTRNNARELAVHLIFELSFTDQTAEQLLSTALTRQTFALIGMEDPLYSEFPNAKQRDYIAQLVRGVWEHCAELDGYISKYAIGWSFARISRMAAAVMRVAMYDVLYMPDIPPAAAINEAVELSKHYETQETASFINGILGAFVRGELPPERASAPVQTRLEDEP